MPEKKTAAIINMHTKANKPRMKQHVKDFWSIKLLRLKPRKRFGLGEVYRHVQVCIYRDNTAEDCFHPQGWGRLSSGKAGCWSCIKQGC